MFDLDEESGKAVVLAEEVAPTMQADARRAEANCPVAAIRIEG